MTTKIRNYTTISIPVNFEKFIPALRSAYKRETGFNVTRGETIGIALQNECNRLGIKAI